MNTLKQGLLIACLMAFSAEPTWAGEKRYFLSVTYKEECGSCHIAYPPALLSATSWRAVMAGLSRHFGSDASLDPVPAGEIARYLDAGAATGKKHDAIDENGQPSLRITDGPWFRREHRDGHEGIVAGVWKRPSVKTPANCSACHQNAEQGSYSEHEIVIPRS